MPAALSDMAGEYVDVLTIIMNKKLGVKDLSKMIFSFPTPTYGLIFFLLPLYLKKQHQNLIVFMRFRALLIKND